MHRLLGSFWVNWGGFLEKEAMKDLVAAGFFEGKQHHERESQKARNSTTSKKKRTKKAS